MSDKLVMGYWNCSYCHQKIEGTKRECPNCGHARDENTKFYMDKQIQYLSEEESKTKGKGEDWICPYCNSLNSILKSSCESCGSDKNESKESYFTRQESNTTSNELLKDTLEKTEDSMLSKETTSNIKDKIISKLPSLLKSGLAVIAVILFVMSVIISLKPKEIVITETNWINEINIEAYETVQHDDWSLPDDGKLLYTKEEYHHTDHVLDHYETVQKSRQKQVYDGEETHTSYTNNGDGTFTEHTYTTPKYRYVTEYYYENEPVYKDVPVYKTKYYYERDEWIQKRKVVTKGNDKNPYWGDVELADNEREGTKESTYKVSYHEKNKEKIHSSEVSESLWNQFYVGESYEVKTQLGQITEIIK